MSTTNTDTNANSSAAAGWYPTEGGGQRYWDGAAWTAQTRPTPSPGDQSQTATPFAAPTAPGESAGYGAPAGFLAGPSRTKTPWYKRAWVLAIVALLVGIGIGGASAGGTSDPKTSSAYKDLAVQLTQTKEQAQQQAQQQAADDKAQLEKVQGTIPARESALKKGEARLRSAQAAVSARETSVGRREKAVGIVERTIAQNTVSGNGMYKVGVGMKPGTYKSNGSSGCYYAVLNSSDTNDISTNNLTDGPAFVTVSVGRYFETQDCADWVLQQ